MTIVEAPIHRRPDEEPDYGEEGYRPSEESTDTYSLYPDEPVDDQNKAFDQSNKKEAERIRKEKRKNGPVNFAEGNEDDDDEEDVDDDDL